LATRHEPKLGEPRLGVACADTLDAAGLHIAPQPSLPDLQELEDTFSGVPSDEPLVRPTDDRITVLPYYSLAGWANAIPDCWMRARVAARLAQVCDFLPSGLDLVIFDAWRPRQLQTELFAAAEADGLPHGLIAQPTTHDLHPAPHETGGAVDVTLALDGVPLALGTDFDEMVPEAAAAAIESEPGVAREARRLLFWAMHSAGFVVYVEEWWHFEYGTRRWAAITGHPAIYAAATRPQQLVVPSPPAAR
jgi:D-alanyl-D-alanine dipeptidase